MSVVGNNRIKAPHRQEREGSESVLWLPGECGAENALALAQTKAALQSCLDTAGMTLK